jgi:hypothetical protein
LNAEQAVRNLAAREAAAAAGGFYLEPEHMAALAGYARAVDPRQTLKCIGYVRSIVLRWQAQRGGEA